MKSDTPFVHLHIHTEYSLLDGAIRINDLIDKAIKYNMPALAITDHGNMFGAIEFYEKATAHGIKPIIGIEAYIAHKSRHEKCKWDRLNDGAFHIVLLAKNQDGYHNLMKLTSISYIEGFYYHPRIDKEILKEHSNGLIGLSACIKGEIAYHILSGNIDQAEKSALEYKNIFKEGDYYLELMDVGLKENKIVNNGLLKISRKYDIPVVATNDVHYLDIDDFEAHDSLICIQTKRKLDDPNRWRFESHDLYFKSQEEMINLFKDIPEAIRNTYRIAEKCNLILSLDPKIVHLPHFNIPDEYDSTDEYLRHLTYQGLLNRYSKISPEISKRTDYELSIIEKMGFAGYFLIIRDIISIAKDHNISVGPGRGSAVGSIVLYSLGITNVNPLEYNLLFERFLNPERVTMPDVDIDFEDIRRDDMIRYLREKYGKSNIAQIITFGKMKTKMVIKDVGRVLDIPYNEVNEITKIYDKYGDNVNVKDAFEHIKQLVDLKKQNKKIEKLAELSSKLENLTRQAGTHASGVVIAPEKINEFTPLYWEQGKKSIVPTTQYSMKNIEKIGLLKVDLLGLRNLTVINDGLQLIKKNKNIEIDTDNLPLNDDKTYRMIQKGETYGVFQLENDGMRQFLRTVKPTNIKELIFMISYYRPGPLQTIDRDELIRRKTGKQKIEYPHPKLKDLLKETYGYMIYQEQIMMTANILAGFTLGEADILRRAMGKKNFEVMQKMRINFIEGAKKNGIGEKKSNEIFNMMEPFAQYGFNKSHAAGYAALSYRTAYLKAHFPIEFMTAILSSYVGNMDQIVKTIKEVRRLKIHISKVDINSSDINFTTNGDIIFYPFSALKNVGIKAGEAIIIERNNGNFESFIDFCKRINLGKVNKKVVESLIKAGAFDLINSNRAELLGNLPMFFEYASKRRKKAEQGNLSLFETGDIDYLEPEFMNIDMWDESQTLLYEKEVYGFFFSGHPLEKCEFILNIITTHKAENIHKLHSRKWVVVGGVINAFKNRKTQKKTNMATFKIQDLTGEIDGVIFPQKLDKYKHILKDDAYLIIAGYYDNSKNNGQIEAIAIYELQKDFQTLISSITYNINLKNLDTIDRTKEIFNKFSGDIKLYINYCNNGNIYILKSNNGVGVTEKFIESLNENQLLNYVIFNKKRLMPEQNGNNRKSYFN